MPRLTRFIILAALLLATIGVIAAYFMTIGGSDHTEPTKEAVASPTLTKPHPDTPKLSCFDDRQCLVDKAESLLKLEAESELKAGGFLYGLHYGGSYGYGAELIFEHTGNDAPIRRVLSALDNEKRPQFTAKDLITEQLRLAAVLNDKPLLARYLEDAKRLLQAQSGQLRSKEIGIKPQWMLDASGVPNESWLALTKGEYDVANLVAKYVSDGLDISPKTGLERLRQYKPYLDDYRHQLTSVLEAVVAEKQWLTWQAMLGNNPKYFDLFIDRVEGNDRDRPLLPSEFVPWETLKERILAGKRPQDITSEMYAHTRFAARDLSPQVFSDFLNTVTVLTADEKEDYATYFVKQLIKNKRNDDAQKAMGLLTFEDDQQERLNKRVAEAINPKPAFEDNFTFADYQDYAEKDPVHGPCQYLQDLKEDSSHYLMSSSHAYLARKRIKDRGAIFQLFGKDIEASCQLIEKPCDTVYYLHKLGHYSEQRPSIIKAMIKHINTVKETHVNTLSCNIYFLSGQLPFINETKDEALFEDVLSIIESKLPHPMNMSGFRGLSDEYHLYARGIADSFFIAFQKDDKTTIQRLVQLIKKDKLQSFFLDNDFSYRLIKTELADVESTFRGMLFLINAFHSEQEARDRDATELVRRLSYDYKTEKFADKLASLLTSFDDVLTDKARHAILSGLLKPNDEENKEYPKKWWELLTQQVLKLKLGSIQKQIEKHQKAEEYEYIEKEYSALQQALASHAKPQSIEAMLAALKHYRGGLNYNTPADDLLIKLLKKAILGKNIGVVNRIASVFQSAPQTLNNEIDSGIYKALVLHNPLYAFALHQLRPDPQPYLAHNQQEENGQLKSLSTKGVTLKDILADKPSGRHLDVLFCQLVQQKFTYEAEQLLLAAPSLYNTIDHQNQHLCSLNLAIQLRSQPMVDHIFTSLRSPSLINALLKQSARFK